MALEVKSGDIQANQTEARKMEDALNTAKRDREAVLGDFNKMLKVLDDYLNDMKSCVGTAKERVKYHQALQKEVKLREEGKRRAELEDDDDRRVKEFIGVVKKKDVPAFMKANKDFDEALKAVKDAMK